MPLSTAHVRVARPTNDIEALLPFYVDGLGLAVLFRFAEHEGFDGVLLGHPSSPADAALTGGSNDNDGGSNDGGSKTATPSAYHLEFTRSAAHDAGRAPTRDNLLVFYLPGRDDYAAAVGRMQRCGFGAVPALNPYWDRCGATFEDPDGYRVVLANMESPV